ncbi:hypothetical protein [Streptosporangium canum]|uniref:hypothetical protein n=1 Tax=Streptosporangium canum TaxID=324952 RepID=UPI00379BD426
MSIRPGQVYESCHPLDEGRRIRIAGKPVTTPGVGGFGKVQVETVTDDGRGIRRRSIEITQLHASATTGKGEPRRTGYRLVIDAPA